MTAGGPAEQGSADPLRGLSTALLTDALGKTGGMDHEIRCRSAAVAMGGPAFTVRVHPADILMVGKALSECPPGCVLVVDGRREPDTALWGAITTVAARVKGLAGVVIDGAIRDSAEIARDPLPVFSRSVVPNAGGAEYAGEIGVTVQCGGLAVRPADWVFGDADGVAVVPAERLDETLAVADRLLELEKGIEAQVEAGADLAELLRYDEVLEDKARKGSLPQVRFQEPR